MKFSMIFEAQLADPTPERERQNLHDCVEQAVYAEAMGFDGIWAVEHHSLKWYAHMSAPEIFLTYVAAKTSRIRIGHGVVLMPFKFNHPARVAERAAMLDVLSNGRVNLGGGRGATAQEMSLCQVDVDDTYPQVEETFRMISQMWRKDEFEWHGSIDIPPHPILPRPVQNPHPPFFMACSKADTLRLAADYGVGALVLGFAGPDEVAELNRIYVDAIAARTGERFVSTEVNDHFAVLCPTIVLDDRDQAIQIGVRAQRFFAESIGHWYGGGPEPDQTEGTGDVWADMETSKERLVVKLHEMNIPVRPASVATFNPDHGYGSVDDAIRYVQRLIDSGANEIMCLIQMGTVPQEICMETIRQWGERVIPHFR